MFLQRCQTIIDYRGPVSLPGSIVFSPGFDDSGSYPITVTVTDDGVPVYDDEESFTLSVGQVNRPPDLISIPGQSMDESDPSLTVVLSASDPDVEDSLVLSTSVLPGFAGPACVGDMALLTVIY